MFVCLFVCLFFMPSLLFQLGDDGICLTNIGPPRPVSVDRLRHAPVGGYVYLAPEVLKENALYTSAADMYSLGILCWELWHERPAFERQRQKPLKDFAEGLTDEFLQWSFVRSGGDYPFVKIARSCVVYTAAQRKDIRMCIKMIKSIVSDKQ